MHAYMIPLEIINDIVTQANLLQRREQGWNYVNNDIRNGLNVVKRTNLSNGLEYTGAVQVRSFYSEEIKRLSWTKRSDIFMNTDIYVWGDPFVGFDFM